MRRRVVLSVVALAVTGCSISSHPANVDHMRCVKAHDEYHDDGNGGTISDRVATICDLYSPNPERP